MRTRRRLTKSRCCHGGLLFDTVSSAALALEASERKVSESKVVGSNSNSNSDSNSGCDGVSGFGLGFSLLSLIFVGAVVDKHYARLLL